MSTSQAAERTRKPLGWKRIVGYVISVVIVVAIFVWAIPKFADYRGRLGGDQDTHAARVWSLVAATIFNLVTYWWANQAALPGLASGRPRSSRRRRPRSRTRSRRAVRSRSV